VGAGVTELGYIGLTVGDLEAWKDFACNIIGMETFDADNGEETFLRLDHHHHHHRIALTRGPEDDLLYLGWRVPRQGDLEALARTLEHNGIAYSWGSEEQAQARHVLGLLKLKDPAGIDTEVFFGPEVDLRKPFHPGRPMHGKFITGNAGVGHCFLRQPDPTAALRFYGVLGMTGGVECKRRRPDSSRATTMFMHCNGREHSIGFAGGKGAKKINHLMIEYTDLNDLGIALDLAAERQIPIPLRLGRHSNDRALSFYLANPSGWLCELGFGGEPPTAQAEYYLADVFGHQVDAPGYGF
jgi:2,3-dihydroxyethylbenzene 1,2-dioxygenase